ncbi:hypothetical protein [Protaetiibacter larvae]|uniref:Uncharacterized protein n=1 Tax=Protaetiibacter larvae TaxID=2592654 RepID=A0A5C1Y5W8_9MICO|nr:hypothetical protein [Protaetiibacter larvae]QEO08635.1 hypothetical protein FLP23_00470 [Protaetiibacter larvae]
MKGALARVRGAWTRNDLLLYVVVAVAASVLAYGALALWRADLGVPLTYWGDALAVGSHFKTVIENGWYEFNPLLGAPAGQTYNDFPTADNLNFIAAAILGRFFTDWPVAMNLYFLIGFPLAAVSMTWFLRVCGSSKAVVLALAPLFAIAPYHFSRGEGHLFLASYFVLPLSLVLVVRAIRGEPLWGWRDDRRAAMRLFGRGASTLTIVALTATSSSYYSVFFLILLAFAGIAALITRRAWRRFWGAAVAGGLTVVAMLVNMLPDMVFAWINGANPAGLERGHAEAEIYALKLSQLILPWPGHRIPVLRELRALYDANYPLVSESPALGAVAAAGFVAMLLFVAYAATRAGGWRARGRGDRAVFSLFGSLAALTLVAFLFSSVGGLSTIISFVTTSLRGWNRMSIYIAALSLAATAILLDWLIRAIVRRAKLRGAGRALVAGALAAIVLVVGFVDQTPWDAGDDYAATAARFTADRSWFATVQEAAGAGATIMQLPYQSFPEDVGPTGVLGSEVLIPYLQTSDIAWTGGGIKGRPRAEWTQVLESQYPPAQIARIAAATGMTGILVDRLSMFPGPRATLEAGLAKAAGAPLESPDGRYSYYSLDRLEKELSASAGAGELAAVRARAIDPVTIDDRSGFARGFDDAGGLESRQREADPRLRLINDSGTAARGTLELEFRFDTDTGGVVPGTLAVRLPDGSIRDVPIRDGSGTLSTPITLTPGTAEVTIIAPAPGTDGAAAVVLGHRGVRDAVVSAFAESGN